MGKRDWLIIVLVAGIVLGALAPAFAGEGKGRFKIGYVYIDEEGNLAVHQESFNIDDPLLFSLENVHYTADNGLSLDADLRNITLDNRNLRFSAYKAGMFSFSMYDNRYRRIYSSDGALFTERENLGGRISVTPNRHLKLFGGVNYIDRQGDDFIALEQPSDPIVFSSDYTHTRVSGGAQVSYWKSNVRFEYARTSFEDKVRADSDRKANALHLTATTAVPRAEWVVLSGGYDRRLDELSPTLVELETNQAWAATRVYLPRDFTFNYRFLFARTKHTGNGLETDNFINTATIGKRWNRRGGVRIGYESRIADDLVDRSESNGVVFNGWFNHRNRLILRALLTSRKKEIVSGSTLLGDEDRTRYRVSMTFRDERLGDITARLVGRNQENPDIGSSADYTSFSTVIRVKRKPIPDLSITYSYYVGEFENRSANFEFADHVLTGTLTPVSYKNFGLSAGATYYRSRKDLDIEKFGMNLAATYTMSNGFFLETKYTAFNYDDFIVVDNYYTGNVLEVSLGKDFKL